MVSYKWEDGSFELALVVVRREEYKHMPLICFDKCEKIKLIFIRRIKWRSMALGNVLNLRYPNVLSELYIILSLFLFEKKRCEHNFFFNKDTNVNHEN